MAIRFIGGAGSIESDIEALVKRAKRPHDLHAEYLTLYGDLIESRIKSVRLHRAPGPHGGKLGRWFVEADWPSDGTLPTGRAAAVAFDPFSNARIDGYVVDRLSGAHLPVPPLQWGGVVYPDKEPEPVVEAPVELAAPVNKAADEPVNGVPVNSPEPVNTPPVNTQAEGPVNTPANRNDYHAAKMREKRAAEKLGLTLAQFRERQAAQPQAQAQASLPANVVPLVPHDLAVRRPALGEPELRRVA